MEIESSVSEASTSASPVKKRRREEDQPATLNRVYIYICLVCAHFNIYDQTSVYA